jgi:phosphoglycolate phosphatase
MDTAMRFKAAIFDLDGTLLNTLEDLADAMNAVLRQNELPVHPLKSYAGFVGEGIEVLVRRALPDHLRKQPEALSFVEQMRAEYAKRWTAQSRPYDGIDALLNALTAAGIVLNVLSNKPDTPTRKIVSALLRDWQFQFVRGATADIPKKPDPAAAIFMSQALQIDPQDILFIGDTAIDMRTAQAAQMFGIGALWGFRPVGDLIAGGARMVIRHPQDLLGWL